ncbi:hypothetical protein ACFLYI_01990 [Chloroflexota bacterium]
MIILVLGTCYNAYGGQENPDWKEGNQVPELPRLKVRLIFSDTSEDLYDLEQARNCFSYQEGLVVVEGQVVNSYEELVKLVSDERCKDKEFLEVWLIQALLGGG